MAKPVGLGNVTVPISTSSYALGITPLYHGEEAVLVGFGDNTEDVLLYNVDPSSPGAEPVDVIPANTRHESGPWLVGAFPQWLTCASTGCTITLSLARGV